MRTLVNCFMDFLENVYKGNMSEPIIFDVFKRIMDFKGSNLIPYKDLSKILIELNAKGYNMTPIIAGPKGMTTPYLKYGIQDLYIFNFLDLVDDESNVKTDYENIKDYLLCFTEDGIKYMVNSINEEIKPYMNSIKYQEFSKTFNKVLKKFYKKKAKS